MTNNFTCIIVDDEHDAIELLADRLAHLFKNITILATYTKWEEALDALRRQNCDLLFMDISMPEKNAIELLKLLPGLDSEIIFVTAHEDYALDAFAFNVSGYILKPLSDTDLSSAINKAIQRVVTKRLAKPATAQANMLNEKIGITNKQGIDYINVQDILYLESVNKCTKIVTDKGSYTSSANIGNYKNLTTRFPFFQVHRAYIINLNCILRYESSGLVIMSNKKEIPISRNVKTEFLKFFNNSF